MMPDHLDLWGLFLSAFISATLFPGGSEAVLAALAYLKQHDPWLLLVIATLGNTLGGLSTFLLGGWLARRIPLINAQPVAPSVRNAAAVRRLQRWGAPALLFSWLPFIGDPLCFAAGWIRINALQATLFIAVGKAARYAVILFFTV
jgi:membrane protein YqaA with SNARE-associated domain